MAQQKTEPIRKRGRIGIKATMLALTPEETCIFPRRSYSSVRSMISTMRVEYPEREFEYFVVEDGIEVLCIK